MLNLKTYLGRRRAADAAALLFLAAAIGLATFTLGADTRPPRALAHVGSPGTRAAGAAQEAHVNIVRRERAAGGGGGPVRRRRTVTAGSGERASTRPSATAERRPQRTPTPTTTSTSTTPPSTAPTTPLAGGDYQAFASATSVYVSPTITPEDELTFAPIAVAQTASSAAVGASGGSLITKDALDQQLLSRLPDGITAFSRGAALSGLHEVSNTADNTTVEATSPGDHPGGDSAFLNPHYPPLDTTVIGASAAADGGNRGRCVVDRPLDEAHADLVTGRALELGTGDGTNGTIDFHTIGLRGGADSSTAVRLVNRGDGHGTVLTQALVTMPEVTLLDGLPAALTIRVVTPFALDLQASGVPGGASATFGPADGAKDAKVQIISGGKTTTLDVPFDTGSQSLVIPFGRAGRLAIGAPTLQAAPDGRSAKASVDVVRLGLTQVEGLPTVTEPVAPALTPLAKKLQELYDRLHFFSLAGGFRELRLGHLEAQVAVPEGGVRC